MNSLGEQIRNASDRGDWAEMRFMARAAEQGFRVSKPWGGSSRYDFALELDGHFLRIQVKSTIARYFRGYVCGMQPVSAQSDPRRYTADEIDFFAAYVIPEDLWYILPTEIVLQKTNRIILYPNRKGDRYEPYKEAWHLLREAVAQEDAKPVPTAPVEDNEPVAVPQDPDAVPEQIVEMRGTVEASPTPGFDPDLVRRRMAGCFERMMKRR
jgi:hypothetical protein